MTTQLSPPFAAARTAPDPAAAIHTAADEALQALERARETRRARGALDAAIAELVAERLLAEAEMDRTTTRMLDEALRRARYARAALLGSAAGPEPGAAPEPEVGQPDAAPVAPTREERKAVSDRALAAIEAIRAEWEPMAATGFTSPETGLDRPALLRARGLLCGIAAAMTQAVEEGADGAATVAAEPIMAEIDEHMAGAGEAWSPPLWDGAHASSGFVASAAQLRRLGDAYALTAAAQEAWGRYLGMRGDLNGSRKPLLECIAAAQALLNRHLRLCQTTDRMQVTLYSDLEAEARREQIQLTCLSSNIIDEGRAAEVAARLPDALQAAEDAAAEARQAEQRRQRRQRSVDAVMRLVRARPDLGADAGRLPADRAELIPLLQEMLEAGEPASTRSVRDALVNHGPALLEGEPTVAAVLSEVMKERERCGIGAAPEPEEDEPEITDEQMQTMVAEVTPCVKGRAMLLLGGSPRKRVCEQLKRALECSSVVWPPSKKSDSPSHHEPDVRRADIVVLIKNYARHGTGDMARNVSRETGADFLMLPSGYGPNQVIYQLHRYFIGNRREATD